MRIVRSAPSLIDDEDLPKIDSWVWFATKRRGLTYARRNVVAAPGSSSTRSIYMHRVVLDAPLDHDVDHINGNGLDNRRTNLRLVTRAENCWNRRNPARGISRENDKWRAYIDHYGKKIGLGYYRDEATALAARAYAEAVLRGKPLPDFDPLLLPYRARQILVMEGGPSCSRSPC